MMRLMISVIIVLLSVYSSNAQTVVGAACTVATPPALTPTSLGCTFYHDNSINSTRNSINSTSNSINSIIPTYSTNTTRYFTLANWSNHLYSCRTYIPWTSHSLRSIPNLQ
ncbi:unnamed protein product [Diamesa tonsa]